MAQPAWLKKYLRMKPEVAKIFEELEEYRNFCVDHGHIFNEADLGNERSPYADFQRYRKGKTVKDNWIVSAKQFNHAQDNYA